MLSRLFRRCDYIRIVTRDDPEERAHAHAEAAAKDEEQELRLRALEQSPGDVDDRHEPNTERRRRDRRVRRRDRRMGDPH
jgi:hypothetical protein